MLVKLDNSRLMHDHKVNVLACACLCVMSCLFATRLTIKQVNGGVEARLRHFNGIIESCKHLSALGSVKSHYAVKECGSCIQNSALFRYFVLIHRILSFNKSCKESCCICVCCRSCLRNARLACKCSEYKSIRFRRNLSSHKLTACHSKCNISALFVVHNINGNLRASVIVKSCCFPFKVYRAVCVTAVSVIVTKT